MDINVHKNVLLCIFINDSFCNVHLYAYFLLLIAKKVILLYF